ncbi:hypothetical protein [Bradyrhizobium diversitatis]|uniref:Uncharacterized protein n=1 Tax=Bradyrhizobium diversitatis TaxID=2755406 RepID=A0ABS0NW61_9BRAD|nr:hypothetical protein [Bradyrhizobium diversitatis]MBH5385250.1 hypothetical protein [Bradyrhizobium diversitatis]
MSKQSPHDLLKRLRELNPNASAAELKELMWDELQRSPEALREAVFDDVWDSFVKETGHRPRNVDDTFEEVIKWLKKPSN